MSRTEFVPGRRPARHCRPADVSPRGHLIRHRAKRGRSLDDAGITLVELMTSMSIMSILVAMFTVGMVQMYRAANQTEARSVSQSQLDIVFLRLDKEIRYATAITPPVLLPSGWYVEYSFLDSRIDPPVRKCSQLWLDTADQKLRTRTWAEGSTAGVFAVIASNIRASQPFSVPPRPTDGAIKFQRLQLSLTADGGPGSTIGPRQFNVMFTALNTSDVSDAATCGAERPIT